MKKIDWTWAHTYIAAQFIFQLILLIPGTHSIRFLLRISAFAMSLLLFAVIPRNAPKYPSTNAAYLVMLIMLLEFCLHPDINSINAGIAQSLMYLAILGPIFWVRGLKITPTGFESAIFLIWGFYTLSSIFGVLQVYYPGSFQPPISDLVANNAFKGTDLMIKLANGAEVYRPMGLSDSPGGAGNAGFYAFLCGMSIAFKSGNIILKIIGISSAFIGLFCIYLSQIRSILIFCGISMLFLALILFITGQFIRFAGLISSVTSIFTAAFSWATVVGGDTVIKRFSALTDGSPDQVYGEHRGAFLQATIDLSFIYPLGAGLGRWGMINGYFGDDSYTVSQPIWVEIQWTGWLLDGGIPMILSYSLALYSACHTTWRIATNRKLGDFAFWGAVIFAYNIGTIAICFGYPLFMSQIGMEFWLLNTMLFVAANNITFDIRQHSDLKISRSGL